MCYSISRKPEFLPVAGFGPLFISFSEWPVEVNHKLILGVSIFKPSLQMGSDHRLRNVLIKGKNHIENDIRMGRAFHDSEIVKSESFEMDANSSLTSALSASTTGSPTAMGSI
jgi:hypothetical protein